MNLETFASVFKPVWDKSATVEIAAHSFKAAGIMPFDPDRVINSEKMAPCVVFGTVQTPVPEDSVPSLPAVPSASSL